MKDVFVLKEELSKKRGLSKGFTLIELLVVVAIIAILAAIAIPQYLQYMHSAAAGAALADARECLDMATAQNTASAALGVSMTLDPAITAACGSPIGTGGNVTCVCTVTKGVGIAAAGTGICSSNSTGAGCTAI